MVVATSLVPFGRNRTKTIQEEGRDEGKKKGLQKMKETSSHDVMLMIPAVRERGVKTDDDITKRVDVVCSPAPPRWSLLSDGL